MRRKTTAAFAAATLAMLTAACGRDAAPPEPGEGAVGTVAVDNAGASETPVTPALAGGPAGQTPDYPSAAGAPSVVRSDGSPPAASSHGAPD